MRLILPLAVALALAGCQKQPEANGASASPSKAQAGKVDRSHAGKAVPTSAFEDPDGASTTLARFRGKPLLLNLWATWCGPCVKEMPALDRLAAAQGGKLQVVALSQDEEGRARIDPFFAKAAVKTLLPYVDRKLAVMGELQAEVLPTTVLFDAQGREVWRISGEEDWQSAQAAALLAEASKPASPSAAR